MLVGLRVQGGCSLRMVGGEGRWTEGLMAQDVGCPAYKA